MFQGRLLTFFPGAKPRRNKPGTYDVRCPVHEDNKPSAMLTFGNGKARISCMVCRHQMSRERYWLALLAATGTTPADWFEDGKSPTTKRRSRALNIQDTYPYYDAQGTLIMEIVRHLVEGKKEFACRRPKDGAAIPAQGDTSNWLWERPSLDLMDGCWLYNYPQLCKDKESPVFIAEGEKDCDYLNALGLIGVTNPFGAGHWHDKHGEMLAGRRCVVLEDNDQSGRRRTVVVAGSLVAAEVPAVKIVRFPKEPEHFDVTDFLLKTICFLPKKPYYKASEVFADTNIENKEGLRKLARDTFLRYVAKESFGYKYIQE